MVVESVTKDGVDGKSFCIELPQIGKSEGVTFDGFISDRYYKVVDYQSDENLVKKSKSVNDVCKLLKSINEWMKNMGLEGDENDNYEELIGPGKSLRCNAGDFLKEIGEKISEDRMFLNDIMFLSDVCIDGSRTTLSCLYGSFHLGCLFGDENGARLFLK